MKPAPFEMERPTRLEDALALLADQPDARVIAGGQSLVPMMNLRLVAPSMLVDLNRIEDMAGLSVDGSVLRIGAMTRQYLMLDNDLVVRHAPLLAKAMPHIGHVQTRNRGTIGGSLAHADPSAELPVVMLALNATMYASSVIGTRSIAAADFFQDLLTTNLQPEEILTRIEIPLSPAATRASFIEFARRHGDFAIASCATQYIADTSTVQVALGGVASVPHRCMSLEQALAAANFSRRAIPDAVEAELAQLSPTNDLHADATLRLQLARTAMTRSLMEVLP